MITGRSDFIKMLCKEEELKSPADKIIPKRRGRPSKNAALSCAVCPFETYDEEDLAEHTRNHTGKTVFGCPYCPVLFSQKGNLHAHIRTHTKERPFTCSFCPFAAAQRGNLVVHLRKHTKEKPYKCEECDYKTAQVANLRSHQTRRHSIPDPCTRNFILKVKFFSCTFCSFMSRRKSELLEHRRACPGDIVYDSKESITKSVETIQID